MSSAEQRLLQRVGRSDSEERALEVVAWRSAM